MARIEGDNAKAQDLYDTAIEKSRASSYLNVLGVANELAMKFYLNRKMHRAAKVHANISFFYIHYC